MRILGIDTGAKRMGVAVSDGSGLIARPLEVIGAENEEKALSRLVEIIKTNNPAEVIIGRPKRTDGKPGESEDRAVRWADMLKARTLVPVKLWDESFSTIEAERILIERNVRREDRKLLIDKVTAAVILQSYLDSGKAKT